MHSSTFWRRPQTTCSMVWSDCVWQSFLPDHCTISPAIHRSSHEGSLCTSQDRRSWPELTHPRRAHSPGPAAAGLQNQVAGRKLRNRRHKSRRSHGRALGASSAACLPRDQAAISGRAGHMV